MKIMLMFDEKDFDKGIPYKLDRLVRYLERTDTAPLMREDLQQLSDILKNAETFSDDEIEKLIWCYEWDTKRVQKDACGVKEIIEKLKRRGA